MRFSVPFPVIGLLPVALFCLHWALVFSLEDFLTYDSNQFISQKEKIPRLSRKSELGGGGKADPLDPLEPPFRTTGLRGG